MVKKKIVAQTQNDDWIPKKVRKKRKPMTPEQRIAAAERLERARAAKAPAKNQTIHQMLFLYQMNIIFLQRK